MPHKELMPTIVPQTFGDLMRMWRSRRRLSQMELALEAGISTRHLSFIENGRSQPSREMILRLADQMDLPLRERNALLTAAGFAASFPERTLDHPTLASARAVIEQIVKAHEPNPALALDRHWNIVMANGPVAYLLKDVEPDLLESPINALRLTLHPRGLADRVLNLAEWRAHLLARLHRQVEASGDHVLLTLEQELRAYPAPECPQGFLPVDPTAVAIPFRLRTDFGDLDFLSATTLFGTSVEVFMSELVIESFFPANPATAMALRQLAG